MGVEFVNKTNLEFMFDMKKVARDVIAESCRQLNVPYDVSVAVTLCDSEEIKRLNNAYRKINSATDVLSFPLIDFDIPGSFDEGALKAQDAFIPDTGEVFLGDIVINAVSVIEQAELYGHSQLREFAFLVAHSMFHLVGFDHMEENEAKDMEDWQSKVLDALNITRD